MDDRSRAVKELFENTELYLTYDYNLQIRKETVEAYTAGMNFANVLDMPSGTGVISIPLLNRSNKLTLIDISANMLAITKQNIPQEYLYKTEIINADFFELTLIPNSYDLIICLGLLAHVSSPEKLLIRVVSLLKPGGLLIIQNTDAAHFYAYLIRLYLGVKNLFSKQSYKLNNVKASEVKRILQDNNIELVQSYCYNQSFLGLSNLFSNEKKYTLTRNFFGDVARPKNQWAGSDYTYLFRKNK